MNQSEKLDLLAKALNKLQATLEGVKKTSSGYNYEYADLAECWNVIRLPLADNGLSLIQTNVPTVDGITIRTMLLHLSGQWIAGEIYLHCKDPTNPQIMGSLNTYARRYALSGMIGLAPVDDDAASVVKAPAPGLSIKQKQLLNSEIKKAEWSVDHLKHYTNETFKKAPSELNNIEFNKILGVIKGE